MGLPATTNSNRLERIPLPDLRRPERMPSLPVWAASLVASLRTETQPHPETGKYRTVPTLPANLTLMAAEREAIEEYVADLEKCFGPTPVDDPESEQATLVLVTKMMLVLPAAKQNEISAEARGEAYMAALDDVPTWAVAAALRRWYRGEAGDEYDYHWCPQPAELRKVARSEVWRIKAHASPFKNLLRAEPLIEYGEEHCHMMRTRLAELMHQTFRIPPVGYDGSGGNANTSELAGLPTVGRGQGEARSEA